MLKTDAKKTGKVNRKQKYLWTCVKNQNNVCKIINNVQKYLKANNLLNAENNYATKL